MLVSIRNLEGKGRNPYQIKISDLKYDAERKCFSIADFFADQWCYRDCPHELEIVSFSSASNEAQVLFEKDVDALKLINWLRTEGTAATQRLMNVPG